MIFASARAPRARLAALGVALLLGSSATSAAATLPCGPAAGSFGRWLEGFKQHAVAQGVSRRTVDSALAGVTSDPKVLRLDRNQKSFKLSFEQFYARRVSSSLIGRGRRLMATHRATLDRIEKQFGVPAPIIIAIWGLETNYGSDGGGRMSIVRSLATLAHDCRRSAFFTKELVAALVIIDRGDMPASQMRGGWAGEIGQTQFLPEPYVKYAVDFDGDGRRDLFHSVPDVLASTASFLQAHGWRAGEGWAPGSTNYGVIAQWNRATVYQRTISVMASKLGR